MNRYTEKYKTLSNLELQKIVDLADEYQPDAVSAAKNELNNRNLNKKDIEIIKLQLEEEKTIAREKAEFKRKLVGKVQQKVIDLIDYINPIQKELPTSDKIIRFVTLGFTCLFLYKLITEFRILIWMFTDSSADWDLSAFFYFFPLVILPITILLFWKRKQYGWIILSVFISYSVSGALFIFISEIGRKKTTGFEALEDLIQTPPPVYYLVGAIIWGAILFTISKKEIREKFNIDQIKLWLSIGIGAFITYFSLSFLL